MHCPFCRHPDSRVIDSRTADDGAAIRRRRSCPECGRRFTTQETVILMVAKRSGVTEPFTRDKIIRGVQRACQGRPVSEDKLAILAQQVEETIRARGLGEVPSHEVGLAILGPLRDLDEVAYLRFASVYRGFESLADFEDEITALRQGASCRRTARGYGTGVVRAAPELSSLRMAMQGLAGIRTDPGRGTEMTETVSGATTRKGKGQPRPRQGGLTIERIHTTPGVHPYDQVTWERRDVVMTNWRDGSVNFEQHGVEFPDFWSVNAANIVTTKYFRGAVGSPQREWSLKQLVDRVVDTYEKAGREHGYFATDEDAEIFGHELRYALVHQIFSFNSPVWFNVGTASPQQVSACQPYDALVSTPGGLVPIGKLVEEDAIGSQGLRRPRRDPDRRDQGKRREAGTPAAHQGRLRARRDVGSSRLAVVGSRYRPLRASREPEAGGQAAVAPAR